MKTNAKTKNNKYFSLNSQSERSAFKTPRSMVEQIYRELGQAIMKGVLMPGQLLTESELQREFRVSRAPIREAIRLLEADKLVVVDAYKKKYVRPITRQHISELIPLMAILEGYGASVAALRLTEEQIDALKETNDDMKNAYDRKKYDLCFEINFKFHRIYIRTANNQLLNDAIRTLKRNIIWLYVSHIYHSNHKVITLSIEQHNEIIEQFVKCDAKGAEQAVRNHTVCILEHSLETEFFNPEDSTLPPKLTDNETHSSLNL